MSHLPPHTLFTILQLSPPVLTQLLASHHWHLNRHRRPILPPTCQLLLPIEVDELTGKKSGAHTQHASL